MNVLILEKYNNNIVFNQVRLKGVYKNKFQQNLIKKIMGTVVLNNLESFNEYIVIESLYYLKLISNKKAFVFYSKKKYKKVDLKIKLDLQDKKSYFLIFLWMIFFFPYMKKRELFFNSIFNHYVDFTFSDNNYNVYPFVPNIYFSFVKIINFIIILNKNNLFSNSLPLFYFNIPIRRKQK